MYARTHPLPPGDVFPVTQIALFPTSGAGIPVTDYPQVVKDGHDFARCKRITGQMLDLPVDSCDNQAYVV
jgi:hypothetical protein